ncbi:MAG: rhodanese-like domain-containing protein [Thermoleophilaceae bacterium]|jgi:rhodanese-related sulfurtransferase|nr:rhodanese-like domain-containing protein [Thermoleophilaceae bacterium]
MPQRVEANRLRELTAQGGQLVEVLPEAEYAELHLTGARNLPLKRLDAHTAVDLDPGRPVIVYCHDAL